MDTVLLIGIIVASVLAVLTIIWFFIWQRRKQNEQDDEPELNEQQKQVDAFLKNLPNVDKKNK